MTDTDPDRLQRRKEVLDKARSTVSGSMGDLWWTFLVRGILAAIVCIAALFWPTASVSILLQLVGLFLVIDGAVAFIGFRNRAGAGSGIAFAIGSIAVGVLLFFMPTASARIVFILIGLWALITGAAYLLQWRQTPDDIPDDLAERGTTRSAGIVACAVGIVLLFWPGAGLVAVGWVIAIAAFVIAAVSLFLASRFRRVRDRMETKIDG